MLNLLDKVVKFNRENDEVRVEVRPAVQRRVEISVSGAGLRLSIVKHAIEQMNGSIAVESRLGSGPHFTTTLPQFDTGK